MPPGSEINKFRFSGMDKLVWKLKGLEITVGTAMALRYRSVNLFKRCETAPRQFVYKEIWGAEMVVYGVTFQLCGVGSAAS